MPTFKALYNVALHPSSKCCQHNFLYTDPLWEVNSLVFLDLELGAGINRILDSFPIMEAHSKPIILCVFMFVLVESFRKYCPQPTDKSKTGIDCSANGNTLTGAEMFSI